MKDEGKGKKSRGPFFLNLHLSSFKADQILQPSTFIHFSLLHPSSSFIQSSRVR
jgi:hypothetical protein